MNLYIESFGDREYRTYARFVGNKTVGIIGIPMEDDEATLRQLVNDISGLLKNVDFELITGVGDITYYFLSENEYLAKQDCDNASLFYSYSGYRNGNFQSDKTICFKLDDHYRDSFNTDDSQTIKECRVFHLRKSFLYALTTSPGDADRDKYPNSYFASMYCNNYQKISDLDRQVLLIHHSDYVSNAITVDEVFNLLK